MDATKVFGQDILRCWDEIKSSNELIVRQQALNGWLCLVDWAHDFQLSEDNQKIDFSAKASMKSVPTVFIQYTVLQN